MTCFNEQRGARKRSRKQIAFMAKFERLQIGKERSNVVYAID